MPDAAFERLAAAILREAQPEYASLLHPGVNCEGKTVKAPLDGIGFVAGATPRHDRGAPHDFQTRSTAKQVAS